MSTLASPILRAFARISSTDPTVRAPSSVESSKQDGIRDAGTSEPETGKVLHPSSPVCQPSSRALQHVLTKASRLRIARWMIQEQSMDGGKHIPSRAVRKFPECFRGSSNAAISRAVRYFRDRHKIVMESEKATGRNNGTYATSTGRLGVRVRLTKAMKGRGRKRAKWVIDAHVGLLEEFERLRKAGVKMNSSILRMMAKRIVEDPSFRKSNEVTMNSPLHSRITARWVQTFMERHNIVVRRQSGKLSVSPEKTEMIERSVAYHLGKLKKDFESGVLQEGCVFNADETHFRIDLQDGRTLAMRGDSEVKYCDVVSGNAGMTMMVMLGGCPDSQLCPPMIVFQNQDGNYPIRGVPDDVPSVCYRTQRSGWMDHRVFLEWVKERRTFGNLPSTQKRVIFMDNASGHKISEAVEQALQSLNTEIRFLPPNTTDLCQPADSFIIQKIKTAWRSLWDKKRFEMVTEGQWTDFKRGSGKLPNPGKRFYLELAASVTRMVNKDRDRDNVLYTRKAMIRCGMALNINGVWEETQLFPHLQNIVAKYRENFEGKSVEDSMDLDGEKTESDSDIEYAGE